MQNIRYKHVVGSNQDENGLCNDVQCVPLLCFKFCDKNPIYGSGQDKGLMWQQSTLQWMEYFVDHAQILKWTTQNLSGYKDTDNSSSKESATTFSVAVIRDPMDRSVYWVTKMASEEGRKLNDLRVVDLRAELEKRSLDKTGVKAVLIEKLQKVGSIPNLVFGSRCMYFGLVD